MKDPKSQSITEPLHEFFNMHGNANHVDQQLWKMLVAAFNSRDFNDCTPLERANMLCLYKSISTLLHQMYAQSQLPS